MKSLFFGTADNTHTSPNGARLNAACSVLGLLEMKDCPLDAYLLPDAGAKAKDIHDNAATMARTPPAMPGRVEEAAGRWCGCIGSGCCARVGRVGGSEDRSRIMIVFVVG